MVAILIDYGIRSTLLLALTGIVVLLLHGRSAAWRHLIWLAGLAALLVLPLATALAPKWNAPAATQQLLSAPMRTVIYVTASVGSDKTPGVDWLLVVWLAGAALLSMRLVRAQLLASRLAERSAAGPAGTRISGETDVPIVCGLWRPVVVLPEDSKAWPGERLESVLRHERMHISRRDTLSQALSQLVCALYWPQPLVWLAASALRRTCEQACDDGVLSQGTKPSAYAGHLMEIARSLHQSPGVAFEGGIAMTRTNQLEERISALLNSKLDRRQAGTRFVATVTALAFAVVLTLAAVRTPLFAQSGQLAGVVRDPSGAVVPKARVDVKSAAGVALNGAKPLHEVVYSNAAGEFSLDMPDGTYDITIAAPGFARQEQLGVLFKNATAKRMEMNLNLGTIQERLQIVGAMDDKLAAEQRAGSQFVTQFDNGRSGQSAPAAGNQPPQRIRVGGNVQAANLIRKVTPLYPPTAKLDGVEGTVIMSAVIGKDGSILSLEQVNKQVDSRLAEAAMEAVKQWTYRPTLLNGQPVEVVTQIDVNFTLMR